MKVRTRGIGLEKNSKKQEKHNMDKFLLTMKNYGYDLHENEGHKFTFVKNGVMGRMFIIFRVDVKTINKVFVPTHMITNGRDVIRIGEDWDRLCQDCFTLAKMSKYNIIK